jgi:hypothetical protein
MASKVAVLTGSCVQYLVYVLVLCIQYCITHTHTHTHTHTIWKYWTPPINPLIKGSTVVLIRFQSNMPSLGIS